MEYGIGVRNRYELFYDEIGDPLELIAKQEEERRKAQAEKKSKALENKNKDGQKPAIVNQRSISAAAKESINNNTNNNKTPTQTGQKNRENRTGTNADRKIQRDGTDSNRTQGDERRHRKPQDGQDSRRFSNKDGKGSRPPRGPRKESEKEFNSKEKRGTDKTPKVENVSSAAAVKPEAATEEEEKPTEDPAATHAEGTEEAAAEPAEPEATEMTLEQWKKEMEARKSKAAYDASIRKPNEGEHSDLQWDKMTRIKKINKQKDLDCITHGPTPNSSHVKDTQEDNLDEEDRKLKRLEETLSKQFHFSDNRGGNSSGIGGRSGRGRGGGYGRGARGASERGGGERGSGSGTGGSGANGRDRGENQRENRGRGNRAHNVHLNGPPKNPTPRVEDLNDFPSLAA